MAKNSEFLQAIQLLKDNGFTIYVVEKYETKDLTWAYLVKGNNIGYMQASGFGGVDFSTVHKPTKGIGTGFGMDKDRSATFDIIEDANKTFCIAPNWATYSDRQLVVKYKDWAEYTRREKFFIYKEF